MAEPDLPPPPTHTHTFFKDLFIICVHHVCMVHVDQKRVSDLLELEFIGGYELPNVDVGN